jgi:hypothetical protein
MKAFQKFSKFMYSFIKPFLLICPSSIIPSTEYMYIISISSAPILDREVIVITNVLNIMYRFLPPLLRRRRSLNTLKDLRTVAAPLMPNLRSKDYNITPTSDPRATIRSKMFHSS